MQSVDDILRKVQIRAHHAKHGNQTTTCPKCSHLRKKKRDRCLSVKIDGVGVQFHCHHCGYEGGEYYDDQRKAPGLVRHSGHRPGNRDALRNLQRSARVGWR